MELRITTLTENTAANLGLLSEWGLSILIETNGQRILLDSGQSISAVHNASLLGIDLSTIDKIVLSHGHIDHTGGLREILRRSRGVEIIAHPQIWASKYVQRPGQKERYVGIPFQRDELENLGARFHLTTEPVRLGPMMTTGEIPLVTDFEAVDPDMYVKEEGELVQDSLPDDQALIVPTEAGLVVVLGCGHRGVINTLRRAQELTGEYLIYGVIGGTHLMRASPEQVERTIQGLKEFGVQRVGVSHCTGFLASRLLAEEFGEGFFLNNAGTSITLP